MVTAPGWLLILLHFVPYSMLFLPVQNVWIPSDTMVKYTAFTYAERHQNYLSPASNSRIQKLRPVLPFKTPHPLFQVSRWYVWFSLNVLHYPAILLFPHPQDWEYAHNPLWIVVSAAMPTRLAFPTLGSSGQMHTFWQAAHSMTFLQPLPGCDISLIFSTHTTVSKPLLPLYSLLPSLRLSTPQQFSK